MISILEVSVVSLLAVLCFLLSFAVIRTGLEIKWRKFKTNEEFWKWIFVERCRWTRPFIRITEPYVFIVPTMLDVEPEISLTDVIESNEARRKISFAPNTKI